MSNALTNCPRCSRVVKIHAPDIWCAECVESNTPYAPTVGVKHDAGKPRWDLLPWGPVRKVVDVLTFGAKKYAPKNWQKIEDARERYYRAAIGHVIDWYEGETLDKESNLPHLAHAVCCLLFLLWFDDQASAKKEEK